jgi:hypothetical protein
MNNSIDYLIRHLDQGDGPFRDWFAAYEVDTYTADSRCPDEFDLHGFVCPDEKPDGQWHLPESAEYPTGSITISFWIRDSEILVFSESDDSVMSLEYFRWYRIPLQDIAPLMGDQEKLPTKTVAALMREGALFRPQGFGNLYYAGKTCALGGALEALHGKGSLERPENLPMFSDIAAQILSEATGQKLFTLIKHPMTCAIVPVYSVVLDLNDIYKWPRDQIAQWLETQPI